MQSAGIEISNRRILERNPFSSVSLIYSLVSLMRLGIIASESNGYHVIRISPRSRTLSEPTHNQSLKKAAASISSYRTVSIFDLNSRTRDKMTKRTKSE
jgi:hypothetical protein